MDPWWEWTATLILNNSQKKCEPVGSLNVITKSDPSNNPSNKPLAGGDTLSALFREMYHGFEIPAMDASVRSSEDKYFKYDDSWTRKNKRKRSQNDNAASVSKVQRKTE